MNVPSDGNNSISFINTFTADSTTAALACDNRGVTRSHILHGNSMVAKGNSNKNTHFCASLSAPGV